MVRTYIPRPISREERARRKVAADLALVAVDRINAEGLIKSWDYRFWPGTTLDRALQPAPFEAVDLDGIAFGNWLALKDPAFDIMRHTVSAWADGHTQEHVVTMLQNYATEMMFRSTPTG